MMEDAPLVGSSAPASLLLGRKLDSIPFSIYHVQIILVLGVVGFVEGYDVALTGTLLVLAVVSWPSATTPAITIPDSTVHGASSRRRRSLSISCRPTVRNSTRSSEFGN